jgi:predicted ABC-type ATPase
VIAGPNGCGKSTLTQAIEIEGRERLLDPDAVARDINPSAPSMAAVAAGREVLKRTAEYFRHGVSFAVETTLSGRGRLELINHAKSRGYQVHLIFVGMDNPDRSILRIRNRVAEGGHFVPEPDVRRRYERSMANVAIAIRDADFARFYDNSGDRHRLVMVTEGGSIVWQAHPLPSWLTSAMKATA